MTLVCAQSERRRQNITRVVLPCNGCGYPASQPSLDYPTSCAMKIQSLNLSQCRWNQIFSHAALPTSH